MAGVSISRSKYGDMDVLKEMFPQETKRTLFHALLEADYDVNVAATLLLSGDLVGSQAALNRAPPPSATSASALAASSPHSLSFPGPSLSRSSLAPPPAPPPAPSPALAPVLPPTPAPPSPGQHPTPVPILVADPVHPQPPASYFSPFIVHAAPRASSFPAGYSQPAALLSPLPPPHASPPPLPPFPLPPPPTSPVSLLPAAPSLMDAPMPMPGEGAAASSAPLESFLLHPPPSTLPSPPPSFDSPPPPPHPATSHPLPPAAAPPLSGKEAGGMPLEAPSGTPVKAPPLKGLTEVPPPLEGQSEVPLDAPSGTPHKGPTDMPAEGPCRTGLMPHPPGLHAALSTPPAPVFDAAAAVLGSKDVPAASLTSALSAEGHRVAPPEGRKETLPEPSLVQAEDPAADAPSSESSVTPSKDPQSAAEAGERAVVVTPVGDGDPHSSSQQNQQDTLPPQVEEEEEEVSSPALSQPPAAAAAVAVHGDASAGTVTLSLPLQGGSSSSSSLAAAAAPCGAAPLVVAVLADADAAALPTGELSASTSLDGGVSGVGGSDTDAAGAAAEAAAEGGAVSGPSGVIGLGGSPEDGVGGEEECAVVEEEATDSPPPAPLSGGRGFETESELESLSLSLLGSQLEVSSSFSAADFDAVLAKCSDIKAGLKQGIEGVVDLQKKLEGVEAEAVKVEGVLAAERKEEEEERKRTSWLLQSARDEVETKSSEISAEKGTLEFEARCLLKRLNELNAMKGRKEQEIAVLRDLLEQRIRAAGERIRVRMEEAAALEASQGERRRQEQAEVDAIVERKKALEEEASACAELKEFLADRSKQVDSIEAGMLECSERIDSLRCSIIKGPDPAASVDAKAAAGGAADAAAARLPACSSPGGLLVAAGDGEDGDGERCGASSLRRDMKEVLQGLMSGSEASSAAAASGRSSSSSCAFETPEDVRRFAMEMQEAAEVARSGLLEAGFSPPVVVLEPEDEPGREEGVEQGDVQTANTVQDDGWEVLG